MSDSTPQKPEIVVADGWTFGPPQRLTVSLGELIFQKELDQQERYLSKRKHRAPLPAWPSTKR